LKKIDDERAESTEECRQQMGSGKINAQETTNADETRKNTNRQSGGRRGRDGGGGERAADGEMGGGGEGAVVVVVIIWEVWMGGQGWALKPDDVWSGLELVSEKEKKKWRGDIVAAWQKG
jgi:hypothetical protein